MSIRHVGMAACLLVPLIFLVLLEKSACAAPAITVGPPFAVMPTPADKRSQLHPAVAWDGKDVYLVVWQQGRLYHASQHAAILAARVDSRGRVLDRRPIVIGSLAASQEQPRVAYSAGRFLVVWHDLRNGRDWDVYGARVNADGKVLEPNGFLIAGGAQNQASPVLAPADNGFLVAWQHYDRYYTLQAALVPAAATGSSAISAVPLIFHGAALAGGTLALTKTGDDWLLSWNDEKGWSRSDGAAGTITRHFARLAMQKGRPAVLDVQRAPAVALGRDGGQFAGDGGPTALYAGWGVAGRGNRVATAALFGAGRATALKNPNKERARAWSGWDTSRMIALHDVSASIDGPVAAAYGHGLYLTVAREAYSGQPNDRNRLLGARLTPGGLRIDKAPDWPVVHESPQRIAHPALAAGNRQFLLVFEQEDVSGRRHIGARILEAE